jgi:Predicted oxidoreductases of the aldo/keto reductase family
MIITEKNQKEDNGKGGIMSEVILGRTGIKVNKNAFGALPIQRVSVEYAGMLLRKAYESGITFFDTARAYSDSEEKIGKALADVRDHIFITTKTMSTTMDGFWADLAKSLELLRTDHVDVYQFHNPSFCPKPGDGTGLFEAMVEAKEKGMIRNIGLTNHRLHVAEEAVLSGLYDTLQFPFSYLSSEKEIHLVNLCKENNVGFIAMKALSGGLITNSSAAYAWLDQFDNVLPIWGIQRENELDEFLSYVKNPPVLEGTLKAVVDADRNELVGNFCRACGYCMPCPVGIEINSCARMAQLIRRSPSANHMNEKSQAMMEKISECLECGLCKSKCPYGLDTPQLLKENLEDYRKIIAGEIQI